MEVHGGDEIPAEATQLDVNQQVNLSLKEWTPQTNLLNKIPEKAQKGFQTFDLHLTCIGVISDYIALGTNVGLIYWYNRQQDSLERLKFEGTHTSPIVSISVVSCENYMIAAGNRDGLIAIFQIPKSIPEDSSMPKLQQPFPFRDLKKNRKVQIYTVRDIHRSCITAITWSSNGMKLFSGDMLGTVAETEIDFFSGMSKSFKLLEEENEIVQLSYSNQNLLISTFQRTFLYSNKTKTITKVGNQDRKVPGPFGGVFAPGLWNKNMKLYAARPGLRVWLADQEGKVQNTLIYKDSFKNTHPTITLLNPASPENADYNSSLDKQFSILHNFMSKYLVTSFNHVLYVLDPVTVKVISSCSHLRSIIALDVYKDEIFIIETNRNIVRISPNAETILIPSETENNFRGLLDSVPSLKPDFRIPDQPFKLIASKLKETSRTLPMKFNSSIITTMKNVLEADLNIQDGYIPTSIIPMGGPADTGETLVEHQISPELELYNSERIEKFDLISKHSFQEVLLEQFKPERRRRRRNGDATSADSVSLSSQGSTNSEVTSTPEKDKIYVKTVSSTDQIEPNFDTNGATEDGIVKLTQTAQDVCETDLRSKEEMLAKMLKWSELLPSFETATSPIGSSIHTGTNGTTGISTSNKNAEGDSSGTTSDEDADPDAEIKQNTYKFIRINGRQEASGTSSDVSSFGQESDVDYAAILEEMKSLSSTTPTLSNDNSESITLHDVTGSSGDYDHYPSIYDNNDTDNISQASSTRTLFNVNSGEFFGPPSGSSNVTLCDGNLPNSSTSLPTIPLRRHQNSEPLSLPALLPVQDMKVSGVILNDYWIQYDLPSAVISISGSDKYLICIDSQNSVYYSSLAQEANELCWIKATFQATHITASSDGATIWKICPTGTLSAVVSGDPFSETAKWEVICDKAKYAVVGQEVAFIIKTDNSLLVTRLDKVKVTVSVPTVLEVVATPCPLTSIHVLDDAIWALGVDGRVFYRTCIGYSPTNWYGDAWNELKINIPPVVSMSIGPQGSVWMVDSSSQICFINDFISSRGKYQMWNVSISEELNSLTAQAEQQNVLTQLTQKLTRRWTPQVQDVSVPILSSCHSVVAFAIRGGNSVFLNKTCASGHKWAPVLTEGCPKNWKLKNVYGGSIYHNHGFLWLEDVKGKIFCLRGGDDGRLQPIDSPCNNIVTIATAPEALWVLDGHGVIYARCNINPDNELGNGWDKIELSPIPDDRKLVHISCGSEIVWSVDDCGDVYIRNGSLNPPSSTDISPAWIRVEGSPNCGLDAIFTKVYVGPSDGIVFALDNRGGVYARAAVFPDLPIGMSWILIPSVEAVSLAISETAVWALSPQGEIFRRCGISSTNFVGDSWKRIPGTAKVLTVSVCDEVWALDGNVTLLKHYVEELYLHASDSSSMMGRARTRMIQDDDGDTADWELLG